MASLASFEPSYPTRSTSFFKSLQEKPTSNGHTHHAKTAKPHPAPSQAAVLLNVIIVGAGLGGLATAIALSRQGHTVTVLEQASALGEVGAGIQIPSNSSRILLSWGLGKYLEGKAVEPEGMTFRRWEDGRAIGYTKLVPEFRRNFGAPYYVVHRAHFHEAMVKLAVELGVTIKVASKVVGYILEEEEDKAAVEVEGGKKYVGDLVVAADGVKSLARKVILGGVEKPPLSTGFAAYRATVDVEKMKTDPEISWLLEKPSLNIWIGEGRHVMTYTISGGNSFNMVLSHTDTSDPSTWNNSENALQDMRNQFDGWDPCLTKVISLIDKAIKWPLLTGSPLPHWIHPSSPRLLILGDAAHAMLPYMSQGAAMAVEDGAALSTALSLISSPSQLSEALQVFQKVRMERTRQMQEASALNGKIWHFKDGEEQRVRDESMRAEVEGRQFVRSANQWSDPVTQWWAYGYDAEVEVEREWRRREMGAEREIGRGGADGEEDLWKKSDDVSRKLSNGVKTNGVNGVNGVNGIKSVQAVS